ncbi:NrfD/PsrC family molybdoenzyme membrane anchor subunit [Arcobacter sp. CECT 8985]|uniref:NrfD/PsrC family molybdoenzyme membrane anchor subunit n=1 Tax=Arcobacter sp. CECT 8985 TaxID=1935424 RepID=UPI00100BCAD6|nr:NrfD/PsrC family molybdoenzyme membrane anchor subunit [Arcobacter sp. CECT 8985]RXJ87138.1 nitrite reductase [Arcobacter sp. CECT 8985]
MTELITYSSGFTEEIGWEWPISVYLLLAGISGGAIIVALLIRFYKNQTQTTPIYKSASLVAFITILMGMVCLVGDLTRPLLFWQILINYNFNSVMSIGVAALMIYIPLTFVAVVFSFEEFIKEKFAFLTKIIDLLKKFRVAIEGILFLFGVVICAYTGFLISVLVRFPLLNTSILPALFVISGLSAGTAALCIMAKRVFNENTHSSDMKILHKIEWPIMAIEILFLAMLYISLATGNEAGKIAVAGFHEGMWSNIFWIGVVFIGFVLPIILNFIPTKEHTTNKIFYISAMCSIVGVLCLRLFIIYAGQTFNV